MIHESPEFLQVLHYLFFPMLFQKDFVLFAWGADDPLALAIFKRLFLLLPVLAFLVGCWTTIFSALSVIVRHKRTRFVEAMLVTWWDLGRSILHFWAGIFRCFFYLVGSIFGLLQFCVVGLWLIVHDIVLIPLRLIRSLASNVLSPGIPWIAVCLTLAWCSLEAVIFSYVTMPLVVDTFSNLTGNQLTESFVKIPLFLFMLFIILGSYAVLSTLADTIKSKNVAAIGKILFIEMVALFVEVVFLYREFVDSLVPWFAQYASQDFQLGMVAILSISTAAWLGIRGVTWFLFASHGTPTIMAIIRGVGVRPESVAMAKKEPIFVYTEHFSHKMKEDAAWIKQLGEDFLSAFMLPPLQMIAASVNFCTLLISAHHLFALPFKNMADLLESKELLHGLNRKIPTATINPEKRFI